MTDEITNKGDQLISEIINAEPRLNDEASALLLDELYSGYPVVNLKRLIESDNDYAASEGAWLLSEIGSLGGGMIHCLPTLFNHRCFRVRYWAIDYSLLNLTEEIPEYICLALERFSDNIDTVRKYAIIQYSKLNNEIVEAVLSHANQTLPCSNVRQIAITMLEKDSDRLRASLHDPLVEIRSAALSAVIRSPADKYELLSEAAKSGDLVVRTVAHNHIT